MASMIGKVLPGAGSAIATMLSTPEGAAKIEAAFAELEAEVRAAAEREKAVRLARESPCAAEQPEGDNA